MSLDPSESPWDKSLFDQRLRLIEIGSELDRVAVANSSISSEVSRIAQSMLATSEGFARRTADQASAAVDTGFYSLLLASIIAIMISGLIVWLYVERRVVRRLESLADAMRRLTDGDLEVNVADEGTHELKALSKAVRAFRDESQQRRALEIERERTNEELRRHREELQILVGERTVQLQDANSRLQKAVVEHAEARAKAEIANRAKSDFLATMSHEIRTPMTGMLGMLRILSAAKMNKEQRRRVDVATNSGEALLGILNSILDYSKIESGNITVDPTQFSLRDVLSGVVELMRPSAVEKKLKLSFVFDQSVVGEHIGDAGTLRQIVFNLVSNAIKFTEQGRISVVARRLEQIGDADSISVSVADTGIGIAARDIGRIFEPFTQTDASITRRFGGTGLGLAISRRLAELMGGSLAVESAPNEGSCFTFAVTLQRAVSVTEAIAGSVEQPDRRDAGLRILAVEDDPATRIVVQHFLESMGHYVVMAVDGYGALDLAARETPDLVLIDISLPGMDGLETARRIRQIDGLAHVSILAMSAHVYKEEVESYLKAGMDGFIGKPLMPEALAAALDEVCSGPTNGRPRDANGDASRREHAEAKILDPDVLGNDLALLGRATVERILDAAESTLPGHLLILRQALLENDLKRLAELAHAMRSAASAAGFSTLLGCAAELERAATAGDAAAAHRYLRECEAGFPEAMTAARRLVAERAGDSLESSLGANR